MVSTRNSITHNYFTQQQAIELIKPYSGQANILTIPRPFIDLTGNLNTALFLSQLLYWQGKTSRSDGAIYKTYLEWEEEIYLTKKQLRLTSNTLKSKGFITTKVLKANGVPTVHYYLNQEAIVEAISKMLLGAHGKLPKVTFQSDQKVLSITETTNNIDEDDDSSTFQKIKKLLRTELELNGSTVEGEIILLLTKYGAENVEKAIRKAALHGGKSIRYLETILENGVGKEKRKVSQKEKRKVGKLATSEDFERQRRERGLE
jgi:hypothetical protein